MPKIPSVYGGSATSNSSALVENYATMAGCGQEQIMTPINVPKVPEGDSPMPGFRPPAQVEELSNGTFDKKHVGPTNKELNPYFGLNVKTDFQVVVHNDSLDDLNIQRKNHDQLNSVRTLAFRGPMMISGWGYDVCDKPVPANSSGQMDTDCATDRSLWKTGPLDVKWDDERQVWSGGPHIVEGLLTTKISKPSSPSQPTEFGVQLRRGKQWQSTSETITCLNRDTSLVINEISNIYVMAIRINYEWRPLWIGWCA